MFQSLYVSQGSELFQALGHFPENGATKGGGGCTRGFLIEAVVFEIYPNVTSSSRRKGCTHKFSIVVLGSKIRGGREGLTRDIKHSSKLRKETGKVEMGYIVEKSQGNSNMQDI